MVYAFLSSPVYGLEDIRTAIHELKLPYGRTIWVDEINNPRPKGESVFYTIEDLFKLIQKASVLIVLLVNERHGSRLVIEQKEAHASYWEVELFYAVLTGKRVQVFEVEGFQPGEKLAALLKILHRALPKSSWSGPYRRKEVVSAVYKFLQQPFKESSRRFFTYRHLLGTVVDGLFRLRGKDGHGGFAEKESLKFLNGSFIDNTVVPNESLITCLLNEVQTLQSEEGRLTRLWIVFRELSGAPFDSTQNLDFLPYWNRFFGEWASAGSWYGLHGHPHLAVLPALIEQAKIREMMRSIGSSAWKEESTDYPGGALASSRYSIAGLSKSFNNRRFLLHAALADLNRSISRSGQNATNLLAIRGSVYRKMGSIGAAVKDYEEVLHRRQSMGASDSAIGEALSELGYGYLFQLRFWRGRALIEEGVRILGASSMRPGFFIRAKRKLAVAYALTGHPLQARDELIVARNLARKHEIFDQIR